MAGRHRGRGRSRLGGRAERRDEAALADGDGFASLRTRLREVLDASDRIPYTVRRGAYLYNFWRDADTRARRVAAYDAGAVPQGHTRVGGAPGRRRARLGRGREVGVGGRAVRDPDHGRALVQLSRDGGDAMVVREFDLDDPGVRRRTGSGCEEAKTRIGWIDADTVFVGTDFGPGSLTDSGYPRTVRRWRRGTPLGRGRARLRRRRPGTCRPGAGTTAPPASNGSFVVRPMDFCRSETLLSWAADGALDQDRRARRRRRLRPPRRS